MRVEKKNKAFAYRVPIGDYKYLQCVYDPLQIYGGKIPLRPQDMQNLHEI